MKIIEEVIKLKMQILLKKRKKEKMNQYKFDGKFVDEVCSMLEECEEKEVEMPIEEKIELMDFKKIFENA